jgi:fatty acid desaturase
MRNKTMLAMTEVLGAVSALAASSVMLAAMKVRGSAVLLHHATHGRLYSNRTFNRWAGEAAGIISLSIGFDEYRRIHSLHHAYPTFAQSWGDEEAAGLLARGFAPGRTKKALTWLFLVTPIDPVWHLQEAVARLKANFIDGPPMRRATAWGLWGGLGLAAAAGNCLPGFFGAMGLLLMAGSVGSYLELVSRHRWNVTTASTGRPRQLELSHWRLPTPTIPDKWTPFSALCFVGSVAAMALWRFVVVPVDLTHHAGHHMGWDAGLRPGHIPPPWTDAALAYSDRLRADPSLRRHIYGSQCETVTAVFDALEKMPLLKRD